MSSSLFFVYVLVFSLSAIACFASLTQLSRIQDPDVRVGLFALLATSGSWATAHVGYLVAPPESVKLGFYVVGLIVGFATIGAWLYFCSAYTGRTYHRQRLYQYLAVAVFGVVVLFKLTNPIHSLYFTTEAMSSPFYHLAVSHGLMHWVAMGLAYALAFVGLFMLFERFVSIGFNATPLVVLVGFTVLPVTLDILGLVSPSVLDMTYEPIGVAVFAVGVLFLYVGRFQSINLAGGTDEPLIFLDEGYRVRDYNRRARELFPPLEGSFGKALADVSPQLAEGLSSEGHVIGDPSGVRTRYFLVSVTPFTAGDTNTGYLLALNNVTEAEQYRRQLEEQTHKLEQFASVVSHDLRNPLGVAQGYAELVRDDPEHAEEHLRKIEDAHERMEDLIEDLLTLAREGQAIEETTETALPDIVERCWQGVETADAELVVETERQVVADPKRLQQLLENLFRNAIEHGGPDVTITVGALDDGFYVEDDGPGIPEDERDDVFEFGYSTTQDGTGFGLSIVKEIADGHGWEIAVTEGDDGGARFELTDVETTEAHTVSRSR